MSIERWFTPALSRGPVKACLVVVLFAVLAALTNSWALTMAVPAYHYQCMAILLWGTPCDCMQETWPCVSQISYGGNICLDISVASLVDTFP